MNIFLIIEQELQQQFHQLFEETKRTESEIIHEALAGHVAADLHYVEVLKTENYSGRPWRIRQRC